MNIRNMRDFVAAGYRGDKWKNKVDRMSDQQITAIYYSMQRRNDLKGGNKNGNTCTDHGQVW